MHSLGFLLLKTLLQGQIEIYEYSVMQPGAEAILAWFTMTPV